MNNKTRFAYAPAVARECRRLLRQPLVLAALLLQTLLTSWLVRGQLDRYLSLQAGGIGNRSVGNDLLVPVLGGLVVALLLTAPLFAAAMRPALIAPWRRLAAMKTRHWLVPTLLAGTVLFLLVPLLMLAALAALRTGSALALWPVASTELSLWLLAPLLLWTCLWLGLQVRALAAALALGWLAMLALAALELQDAVQTPLDLFRVFRDGALPLAGLLALPLSWLTVLFALHRWRRQPAPSRSLVIIATLFTLALATSQLSWRWQPVQPPLLSAAEQAMLAALKAPARLLIVSADPDRRGDYQAELAQLTANHRQLALEGWHPDELPAADRDQLPGREGLLISMAGQSIWLKLPTADMAKQTALALAQLQRRQQRFLVFLEGHGERRLHGDSARDLNGLRQRLDALGVRALSLQLAAGMAVPDNTAVLVLASPTSALLPAEWQALQRYLDGGGALLWLREPDETEAYQVLADYLGVQREPGTVLDLDGVSRGTPHPAIAVIERYPDHAAVRGLGSLAALPWAAALNAGEQNGFVARPLLQSSANSVRVADADSQSVPLDAPRGPFTLAVALHRALGDREQRIVVLGDGHFLADTAINNYGNAPLALALLQWLAFGDDAIAAIDDRPADAELLLSPSLLMLYRWGLPLALPLLLLLGLGAYQWRWRRR